MAWEWRRHDRSVVSDALQRGDYEAIATAAMGSLDELGHLAAELDVFAAATEDIKVNRERRGIPDDLLLRTLVMLPFIDAASFPEASTRLFGDPALLYQLGYAPMQMQTGFNGRYRNAQGSKSRASIPLHPAVLREEMQRVVVASLDAFRQRTVRTLFDRRLIRGTTYAIDGTGLGKNWRVVALLNLTEERNVLVSWRVLHGAASEKGKEATVVRSMIDDVRAIAGPQAIDLLLMDALYADGPLLATLKYGYCIDALVRIPEDRDMYIDMTQIVQREQARWQQHPDVRYIAGHKQMRTVSVAAVEALTTWASFREKAAELGAADAALWGSLIYDTPADGDGKSETWGLVSTRAFGSGWKGYSTWRKRWRVENTAFRELKEGWKLEKARWGRTLPRVATRVAMTCVAFNVAQVFKGPDGRRLVQCGIRRLRRILTQEVGLAPVTVYAGECYGIFTIEEVATALGKLPQQSLQRSPRPKPHDPPPLS